MKEVLVFLFELNFAQIDHTVKSAKTKTTWRVKRRQRFSDRCNSIQQIHPYGY